METKVGLAQIRPTLGNVDKNVEKHLERIGQAQQEDCKVVVFPELGLTGYGLKDITFDVAMTLDAEPVRRIVDASSRIDIVFGLVEHSTERIYYNTAVYASQGHIVHVHRKVYLPTYGLFEEGRYFGRGEQVRAFNTPFGRAGMLICEDAWHPSMSYLLAQDGIDVLFLLSASPSRGVADEELPGSEKSWRTMLQVYARLYGIYICFVNRVGFEDGIGFFGGSILVDPFGRHAATAREYEESLTIGSMDFAKITRSRLMTPILRDENTDLVIRELSRIRTAKFEQRIREERQ